LISASNELTCLSAFNNNSSKSLGLSFYAIFLSCAALNSFWTLANSLKEVIALESAISMLISRFTQTLIFLANFDDTLRLIGYLLLLNLYKNTVVVLKGAKARKLGLGVWKKNEFTLPQTFETIECGSTGTPYLCSYTEHPLLPSCLKDSFTKVLSSSILPLTPKKSSLIA